MTPASLPGYDAWKLTAPGEDRDGECAECGCLVSDEDEPLNLGDGWACSTECEAMHNLRQADGPTDVLAAADVAYGEGCEFVLRLGDFYGGEMLCSHLARNDRSRMGTYVADDLDGLVRIVPARGVERAEVVG